MTLYIVYRGRITPSGGHKHLRIVASLLNEVGLHTLLLPDGAIGDDHLYGAHPPRAPFEYRDAASHLVADDVVIHPEARMDEFLERTRHWACRRAIFSQNGYYALDFRPPGGFKRNKVDFVVASSPYIAALTTRMFGMPPERVFYVPYWVHREPFAEPFDADVVRAPKIAFMPRKLPEHCAQIRTLVEARRPDWQWVPIDNLPELDVSRLMRTCGLFLSTQDLEGFGLPAIEAMACGCVVAGYPGTGRFPHPYASPANGLWVRDRAPRAAAEAVLEGIRQIEQQDPRHRHRQVAGRAAAESFSRDRLVSSLIEMIDPISSGNYERRLTGAESLSAASVLHAHLYLRRAAWTRPAASARRWARRAAAFLPGRAQS
jgi:glycosyltransferase involved in cell wall biosynthesis